MGQKEETEKEEEIVKEKRKTSGKEVGSQETSKVGKTGEETEEGGTQREL